MARIGRATLLQDEENGFEQITYYQTGLGADAEKDANTLDQVSQGGRGIGVTSNVREAYGFLCNNYDFGDEIYITGFSRGAFTARSVAGLIGTCGILTRKGLGRFYETLQYYKYSFDKSKQCPVSEEVGSCSDCKHSNATELTVLRMALRGSTYLAVILKRGSRSVLSEFGIR